MLVTFKQHDKPFTCRFVIHLIIFNHINYYGKFIKQLSASQPRHFSRGKYFINFKGINHLQRNTV